MVSKLYDTYAEIKFHEVQLYSKGVREWILFDKEHEEGILNPVDIYLFVVVGQRLNRYLIYSSLNYTFMLYVLFCTFVIFQIKEVLKMTARWSLVQKKERDKKRSLPLLSPHRTD